MSWLERRANKEVDAIETPIGYLPKFDDLKKLFKSIINKEYTEELYIKQFSLYIDNILARIVMQKEAYGKNPSTPKRLFNVLDEQQEGLMKLREKFGHIVKPSQL